MAVEEVDTTLFIPPNFSDSGKVLNTFKTRNLIEAIAFSGAPGYLFWNTFHDMLGLSTCLVVLLFVFVPIFILCLTGINEDSLTVFISHIILFMKNKKKMRFKRIKPQRIIIRSEK